jgi:uncharacterized RDD family membrane protein YckC
LPRYANDAKKGCTRTTKPALIGSRSRVPAAYALATHGPERRRSEGGLLRMDERPPGEGEPQSGQPEPTQPPPAEPPWPAEPPPAAPAPLPWEQSSPEQPRSTIISAEPVLTEQPGTPGPEVAWAAPPPPSQGREVPGAPGFAFASTPRRLVAWIIDNLLIGIAAIVLAAVIGAAANLETTRTSNTFYAIFSVIYVALSLVYFVLLWTGGSRATPGMRALKLQVGTAFDGRPLEISQAILRWALLGYPLSLAALIPSVSVTNLISLVAFLWSIALLVSTIASDTKQGIHDRVARSAMVEPAGLGSSALVTACLLLAIIFIVLPFVAIIGLIFLGGQISGILDEVGRSI